MEKSINTFKELEEICQKNNKQIYEVIQKYEAELAETSEKEIRKIVKKSLDAMKESIKNGLQSKEMSISGMCGDDCDRLQKKYANRRKNSQTKTVKRHIKNERNHKV